MGKDNLNTVQGRGGTAHSRIPQYQDWIAAYLLQLENDPMYIGDWTMQSKLRGQCLSACRDMQEVFPELKLVRGIVTGREVPQMSLIRADEMYDPGDGHFWLETPEGHIVDPTALQFGSGVHVYTPLDESTSHMLPTGKCPNCGDYCYNGRDLCDEECEESYRRYILSGV